MLVRRLAHFILPVVILSAVAAGASGCRVHHVRGPGRAAVEADEGVRIRVQHARVRGKNVIIKTSVMNQSGRAMVIHRDELGLRLADGTVLAPARGRNAEPVVVGPGEYRTVRVVFPAYRSVNLSDARLVIGGVDLGQGSIESVGELALRGEGRTLVIGRAPRASDSAPDSGPGVEDAQEATQDSEDAADEVAEEGGDEGDEVEEPAVEEREEGWVIGGG